MTPEDIAYLRAKAGKAGYNADDLLKMINYESSGRHNIWGGKGKRYFGLFQAGPSERAQFGVDTVHPSATNQIDALMRYLPTRGFKPGMGLLDLYSTINAGSPGHYNASDGNGTVATHVAKMMGMSSASPTSVGGNGMSLAFAPIQDGSPSGPLSIEDLLQQPEPKPQNKMADGLVGLRQTMQGQDAEKAIYDEEKRQQMKELHDQIHQASVAGLLGRM